MISVSEALHLVLAELPLVGAERVMLRQSRGRVLAEDVVAGRDIPPFRNSAMDGYAVRADDLAEPTAVPVSLRVLETVGAGSVASLPVISGTAIRIMTGSPVPEGADAIVRVEDTAENGDRVLVNARPQRGANVREAGEDMRAGQRVLNAGRSLRPADIGLLASLGHATVSVRRRPRVAVLATGDELVEVGEPLGPGQIVNSNAYTLAAAVEEIGGEPLMLGVARDRPELLRAAFADALHADMVLSTGGVSVGNFDYVRQVQADLGVVEKFWGVAQKPGKPLSFGLRERTPLFGLPGNPVSALVCFYVYVMPALRQMAGAERRFLPAVFARAETEVRTASGLTEFVRCRLEMDADGYHLWPTGSQSSGVLRSMSAGEALAVSSPDVGAISSGSMVRALLLGRETTATSPF